MQSRIFNTICLLIILMTPIALFVNLFLEIRFTNLALSLILTLTGFLYYRSRFLGKLKSSQILFSVFLHVVLVLSYFFNSGILGPTLILFVLAMIFIIAVMPNKQYFLWAPLNAGMAVALLTIEYFYPDLIRSSHSTRLTLFLDTAFTYLYALICIAFVLTYILRSYQLQRQDTVAALKALKKADDSKTKLLSILSHDLKAPLNSIQSFLELLVEYDLEPEEEKMIKVSLLKETKNTQVMLFNMLSWTKAQMVGGIQVSLGEVNLQRTLEVSIAVQKVAAAEKMIVVNIDIDDDLCVYADQEMINLVVRNLLNNAIKFTMPGGVIDIVARNVDGLGVLTVKDNGIGMSAIKQAEVFMSNSGATYGTANEKGVGLGLMLCKEFTELQGGTISFESVEGEGSVFMLSLPLCVKEAVVV